MRFSPVLGGLLAVLSTVASGSLECTPAKQAWAQHRGAEMYGRMCAVCHGQNGEGYKADQAPMLAQQDFLSTASDDYLRTAITSGRPGTTMSAWGREHGGPLKPADVDATITFMRTWQKNSAIALDERPSSGDPVRGATTYASECQRCHGTRGTGGTYIQVGSAQLLKSASNGYLRYAIHHGRSHTAMPAFDGKLDDGRVEDVLALMRTWEKAAPPQPRAMPARTPPIPLGPVPLNPKGPEPVGFKTQPGTTQSDVIKQQLDRNARMAILDARAPSDYANEHIAGAVSVPFYDPDGYFDQLPKDAWLVCYCSCPHAESGQLASKLVAHGFRKVTVLDEGLGFWSRRGYPTRSGLDP